VAVAASYPDDLAQHFKRFLGDAGIEVVSFQSNDIATAGEVGLLGKDEVIAMAKAADHPDAQAILIPDTAMHSLRWVDDLEEATGKVVLTANQVTVWEGLRIAGRPLALPGLGTLFRT
jgi:maleate cis-trans isomerase